MKFFSAWYKRRYHLNFVHAKKLFVFDIALLSAVFVLAGLTAAWFFYDPTVTRDIALSIAVPQGRIQSGDRIVIDIAYRNNSDTTLTDVSISTVLPDGFVPEGGASSAAAIPDVPRGADGTLSLAGTYYAMPGTQHRASVTMSYTQAGKKSREEKTSALLLTASSPAIAADILLGKTAIAGGRTPIRFRVTNTGSHPTPVVEAAIVPWNGAVLVDGATADGFIREGRWDIDPIPPGGTAELSGFLIVPQAETAPPAVTIVFAPMLRIGVHRVPQPSVSRQLSIIVPDGSLRALFADTAAAPGDTIPLTLSLANDGAYALTDARITIPIPDALVDARQFLALNGGVLKNGAITIDRTTHPALAALPSGGTATVTLRIPIRAVPNGGTDIFLQLAPRASAAIEGVTDGWWEAQSQTAAVPIGTSLTLDGSIIYYTEDGDQIGRGPLPPRVGQETKYGAILTVRNTTSRIERLTVTGLLTPSAIWTGKTSVSLGKPIAYDNERRQFSWSIPALEPYDSAVIFIELGIIPRPDEAGSAPILLHTLTANAEDGLIHRHLSAGIQKLDISLANDPKGGSKGALVLP